MICRDTAGNMEAIHVPKETIELALALAPYVRVIQDMSEGNGDIILPFRGGVLANIKLDLQAKLRKLIRFSQKQS